MTCLLLELPLGASPANNPMQWAVLAFGIVFILYVTVIRPMRKAKSRPDPLERKPTKSSLAQQRAIERDMGNLLVQYEEMIRRMTAQVDIRATKLEMLIREAEEKIAQLNALISAAKADNSPQAGLTGSTGSPQASSPQASSAQAGSVPGGSGQTPNGDAGANQAAIGDPSAPTVRRQGGSVEAAPFPDAAGTATLEARKPVDEPGPGGKIDERHAEIYRLADGGRTARQIAQELNRPDGEVELILHLRSPRPRQGDLWDQPAGPPADATPAQAEAFNPPEPAGSGDPRRKGRKKQRVRGNEEC